MDRKESNNLSLNSILVRHMSSMHAFGKNRFFTSCPLHPTVSRQKYLIIQVSNPIQSIINASLYK